METKKSLYEKKYKIGDEIKCQNGDLIKVTYIDEDFIYAQNIRKDKTLGNFDTSWIIGEVNRTLTTRLNRGTKQ